MDPCNCDDNAKILAEIERPDNELLTLLMKAFQLINQTRDNDILLQRIRARMGLGLQRYGHGIRVEDDTRQWGTRENSWLEMCEEEILDGIVYAAAHGLRS